MRAVPAAQVAAHGVRNLVVDPVLVATSGDALADDSVAAALRARLFPLAALVTPNLAEAGMLLGGRRIDSARSTPCCGLLALVPHSALVCLLPGRRACCWPGSAPHLPLWAPACSSIPARPGCVAAREMHSLYRMSLPPSCRRLQMMFTCSLVCVDYPEAPCRA